MPFRGILEYVEKSTWLHKTDPLAKILYSTILIFLAFIIWNIGTLIFILLFQTVIFLSIRPPSQKVKFYFKVLAYITITTILSQSLFYYGYYNYGEGRVLVYLLPPNIPVIRDLTGGKGVAIIYEGFIYGFIVALKIIIMMITSLTVIYTTKPGEILKSLIKIGAPPKFAIAIVTALRFLPMIFEEVYQLTIVMRLKKEKIKIRRLPRLLYLMVKNIIVESYKRAFIIGIALEVRGIPENPEIPISSNKVSLTGSLILFILGLFIIHQSLTGLSLFKPAFLFLKDYFKNTIPIVP